MIEKHVGVWVSPDTRKLLKEWWEMGMSAQLIAEKFAAMGITVTNSELGYW